MTQYQPSTATFIDKIISLMIPLDLFSYTPTLNISGGFSGSQIKKVQKNDENYPQLKTDDN